MKYQTGDKVMLLIGGGSGYSEEFLEEEDALNKPSEVMEVDLSQSMYYVKMPSGYENWVFENEMEPYTASLKFKVGDTVEIITGAVKGGRGTIIKADENDYEVTYCVSTDLGEYWKPEDWLSLVQEAPVFKFEVPDVPLFEVQPHGTSLKSLDWCMVEMAFPSKDGQAILEALSKTLGIGGLGMYVIRFSQALHIQFKTDAQRGLYPQIIEQLKEATQKANGSVTISSLVLS